MSLQNSELQPCIPSKLFDLDTHLPYRLGMLTNLIRQVTTNTYIRRSGLSGREWRVLAIIGLKGAMQPAEAANLTGMDRATVTRAVDKLVEQQYLLRENDALDGRKIRLHLTKKGADKCDEIFPEMGKRGSLFEAVLDDVELQQLYGIFDKLQKQAHELLQVDASLN